MQERENWREREGAVGMWGVVQEHGRGHDELCTAEMVPLAIVLSKEPHALCRRQPLTLRQPIKDVEGNEGGRRRDEERWSGYERRAIREGEKVGMSTSRGDIC